MSYIRTHQFAKTLFAILLGLPFVLGVFSNARPAMPNDAWAPQAEQPVQTHTQQALFSHIDLHAKPQA